MKYSKNTTWTFLYVVLPTPAPHPHTHVSRFPHWLITFRLSTLMTPRKKCFIVFENWFEFWSQKCVWVGVHNFCFVQLITGSFCYQLCEFVFPLFLARENREKHQFISNDKKLRKKILLSMCQPLPWLILIRDAATTTRKKKLCVWTAKGFASAPITR